MENIEKYQSTDLELVKRLEFPKGKIDVVLDTDTYNEIDDQFAIAYMLKSADKLTTKAIYAAPFYKKEYPSVKVCMERSYDEIINLLTLMNKTDFIPNVYKGSEIFLTDEKTPVVSSAANDLAKRAMEYTKENPLYVIAIGALTNVASAILMNPAIIDKIVVVWLGGSAYHMPNNHEFNCSGDIAAARIVMGTKLAFVQLPCGGVVSAFTTTKYELEHYLKDKNPLCDYLLKHTVTTAEQESSLKTWSRVIWDVTAVASLIEESFCHSYLEHIALPEYDHVYSFSPTRHLCRYVYSINRDYLFSDLFEKLARED